MIFLQGGPKFEVTPLNSKNIIKNNAKEDESRLSLCADQLLLVHRLLLIVIIISHCVEYMMSLSPSAYRHSKSSTSLYG